MKRKKLQNNPVCYGRVSAYGNTDPNLMLEYDIVSWGFPMIGKETHKIYMDGREEVFGDIEEVEKYNNRLMFLLVALIVVTPIILALT